MKIVKKFFKNKKIRFSLLLFIILLLALKYIPFKNQTIKNISYLQFKDMIEKKEIKSVNINLNEANFTFTDLEGTQYETDNPRNEGFKEFLLQNNIEVKETQKKLNNVLISLLPSIIFLFWVILIFALFKKKLTQNIKNNNIEAVENAETDVKFKDIVLDAPKTDMINIVKFLKNPEKYTEAGAEMPKGIIFYGPPGTGKTLLAKAIAGEAKVPFFSVSGSDFVEMYVGVGAKRVRELFKKAKEKAPCIIFIDEIDSIGGKRGSINSHSEREQTINALLNEIDGFNNSKGILVLAATNRLDILDEALIRPGRFDKHIAIELPNQNERESILKLYARNKKIAEDVDFNQIAKTTIGFSGSDLKILLNEAAIIAVNENRNIVENKDIDKAFYQIIMQGHMKNEKRKKEEIELIAWHEAGHAVMAKLLGKNVSKVTIIPSTSGAGGATFIVPNECSLFTKKDLVDDIKINYGGRIAEFILTGSENKITTGASSDIKKSTKKIKKMIEEYGMTDIGVLNLKELLSTDNDILIKEAQRISNNIYESALTLLMQKKHLLKKIANELIKKETLLENDLNMIYENFTSFNIEE